MKKVLVVDDTKNIRNLLSTCLELNGFTVATANNGLDAINLILKEDFDLAFMDIKMPELSGTEVLRRIRSKGYNFPVIIMTAFATVKNAVECTKLGAVAYLQKPFTAEKVKEVIAKLEELTLIENNPTACIEKAKQLLSENQLDLAFHYLSKALSMSPATGEIYYLIGIIHEKSSTMDEAEKYYSAAKIFGYFTN